MNQVFLQTKNCSKTQRLARRVEVVVAYCGYIEVCSLNIADDQFCLYIFMVVELSDTLSPMHIADGVI